MQQCTLELMDRNPATVLFLDEQKRIVYANRKAEEMRANGDARPTRRDLSKDRGAPSRRIN